MPINVTGPTIAYSAPADPVATVIVNLAKSATRNIYIMDYGYTLKLLSDALIEALGRGVHVYCLFDHTQAHGRAEQAQLDRLTAAKVPWLEGTSPLHHAIMHSKCMIVDGKDVLRGSYNFTESAAVQANTCEVTRDDVAYAFWLTGKWYDIFSYIKANELAMQPDPTAAIVQPDIAETLASLGKAA